MSLWKRLLIGLGCGAIITALWYGGVFDGLQLRAADLGFRFRPVPPAPTDVAVLGIDSLSLTELGPLPWPRTHYATAIRELNKAGAESIAFDMWFADPSQNSAEDIALAEAAQQAGNVTFGMHVAQSGANVKITRTLPSITGDHARLAHVNVFPDDDNKLRSAAWEVHTLSERFLFMPVALATDHAGVPHETVGVEGGFLNLGDIRVPLTEYPGGNERFLLDLPVSSTGPNYISFNDLINGRFNRQAIAGKIVLIGQVIQGGGYADVWATSRGRKFGVLALAEMTQQLLDKRFLRTIPNWVTPALVLLLSLLGAVIFSPKNPVVASIAHGSALVGIWLAFIILLAYGGVLTQPVPLSAALIVSLGMGNFTALRHARRELVRDQRAMDILQELGETVANGGGSPLLLIGKRPDIGDSFILPSRTPHLFMQTISQVVGAEQARLYMVSDGQSPECAAIVENGGPEPSDDFINEINRRLLADGQPLACARPSKLLGLNHDGSPERTLLAMPLRVAGRTAGIVQLHGKHRTDVSPNNIYTRQDLRLVAVMAQQTLIGMENARLYKSMRALFLHATLALANAVDAKDAYTRGHSERVVAYSERTARALDLSERDVQITRLAAVLHDIGKIAIPDEILRKPGRLTEEEIKIMRTHPERGESILLPLEELAPLRPAIRHHHERFDGHGYPDCLAGGNIPLHARIICVADSFDAITSKRYYRTARTVSDGLVEIERCAGTQFDPDIVACFIDMMRTGIADGADDEIQLPSPSASISSSRL